MKKSFFLLTAALVAMFSFSACTDDKDDGDPAVPGPSSSSDGIVGNQSSSSDGIVGNQSSSSDGVVGNPSSSSTGGGSSTIQFACVDTEDDPGYCVEYGGLSPADLAEARAECLEEDEEGEVGTIVNKCPSGGTFICPYSEDGEKVSMYFYGLVGLMIQMFLGGECPESPGDFEDLAL